MCLAHNSHIKCYCPSCMTNVADLDSQSTTLYFMELDDATNRKFLCLIIVTVVLLPAHTIYGKYVITR